MFRYIVILFLISNVSCDDLALPQGSPCVWNGIPGKCVSLYQCLTASKDIANKTFPPICSFEGNTPIICCTDCVLIKDISCKSGLLPMPPTEKKLDPAANCTFEGTDFVQGVTAAAGGLNAVRGEFTHMALLGFGDTIDTADWFCGGSVISERFILTAAHCVFNRRLGYVKFVALGILKRSDPPSLWQTYNVQRAITHPDFKPPSKYHDIALLETDREITFNDLVLPACLHVDDNMDLIASATGWGALGYKKSVADVLQTVRLRKYTDEECSEQYPEHRNLARGIDTSIQLCYGDIQNQSVPSDTCEGDSGGPLHSNKHERCVFTILGVISNGKPCGNAGGAGIYTRVKYYVPWIEEIVWP